MKYYTMLPRKEWPLILQHPKVKSISVGGCPCPDDCLKPMFIRGKKYLPMAIAHDDIGHISFINKRVMNIKYIQIHELAHILTKEGHTDKWRNTVLELGGTLKKMKYAKSYEKKR